MSKNPDSRSGVVRLVPGAAGKPELAELDDYRRELLLRSLGLADEHADLMIIDTASGLARHTLELCRTAHALRYWKFVRALCAIAAEAA